MTQLGQYFNNSEPLVYQKDTNWVLDSCVTGIEIEVENLRARNHQAPHNEGVLYDIEGMWALVSDGSLRNNGGEFISRKLFGKDLTVGLDVIANHLKTKENRHTFSHRCSLHVHIDVRDLNISQLQKLIQLYCIFEQPLFHISGGRDKNEYCIPLSSSNEAKRAYGLLASTNGKYSKFFAQYKVDEKDTWREISRQIQDSYVKYMAFNILPIVSKGSIEFRHHEGTADVERITRWINILYSLKKACIDYPFNKDPYVQLSDMGPMAMLELVFGKYAEHMYYETIELDLWSGCRAAQDMILSFDLGATHSKWNKTDTYKYMISTLEESCLKTQEDLKKAKLAEDRYRMIIDNAIDAPRPTTFNPNLYPDDAFAVQLADPAAITADIIRRRNR